MGFFPKEAHEVLRKKKKKIYKYKLKIAESGRRFSGGGGWKPAIKTKIMKNWQNLAEERREEREQNPKKKKRKIFGFSRIRKNCRIRELQNQRTA